MVGHGQKMTKSECRMTNQLRMTKSDTVRPNRRASPSSFVLRHSFGIRHSCFVIWSRASIQCTENRRFFRVEFFADENELSSLRLKRLQFPAARHEIEKLRAIGEAEETLRANHARRQAICKAFETIARKNFAGNECERFEFGLMPVFQRCDFFLASNSKQQLRINAATLGANNCRGRINF